MNELDSAEQNLNPDAQEASLTKVLWTTFLFSITIAGVCALVFISIANQPSSRFPVDSHFTVEQGMSLDATVRKAKSEGIVRSHLLLFILLSQLHDPSKIFAGNYQLERPITTYGFANILASQAINVDTVTITVPEGVRARTIADIASKVLDEFDNEYFIQNAEKIEGYLFPDTYFLPSTFTADELIALMEETYHEKTDHLTEAFAKSTLSEYEVLILASIIEREANNPMSMKMVGGILKNRMNRGMPLQVDASVEYVLDKPLSQLTPEDLTLPSPYNTYLTSDLPPTPIGNPGVTAIESVLFPTSSEYLFYITDPEGTFHYARTFDEHRRNISRYLR